MAGVQKMICVVDDDLLEIQEKTRDKNVELTRKANKFLKETFLRYDTDYDRALQTSELEEIFSSAPESTWIKAPFIEAAELGGISIARFLSEWALMTVRDPVSSVMNLLCIGYHGEPSSAIRVTKRGCIQSERKVFQCFVFGPEQAGKSALLSTLNGRPFSDNYIPTKEDRYAVNTFYIRGKRKTLTMREIPEVTAKQLLSNKDALAACDIAVFVYDSSSKPSWKMTKKLLRKVETHGYKGPFLIVSTKDDLDSHKKSLHDSIRVSKGMGIDAPISISSKKGDIKDVFQKIILAAEHPHMSIPETVDGKSHKQDHQLADFPLAFKLVQMAGVQKMIRVVDDDFLEMQEKTRDKNVELADEAVEYLVKTFCRYDKNFDGIIEMSQLEKIFSSAPESPWNKAPYVDAAELGGLSIDGFLSEWDLMTVQDPVHSVMNLMYIGYCRDPLSAIHVTQRRCLDRENRCVFQCFVFGPKEAGKSALLNTLIKRPFSDYYIPTKEDRYAVNKVKISGESLIQQEKRTLIMREIPEVAAEHLLSHKDALAACDIAVFVYDSSSEPSWKRTVKLLQKVKSHGYEGPFLIVATKDDLELHTKAQKDSIRVCQNMRIDAPISFSAKKGDYQDVFQKIIFAAVHPHQTIPETDIIKGRKQYHQLANCPLPFESEALEALIEDHVEAKEYVWMILSVARNSAQKVGGALCIDASGILITTVIATYQSTGPMEDKEIFSKSKIPTHVQAVKDGRVWEAKLEKTYENCGILLYRIVRKNTSIQFPSVNLEAAGSVRLDGESRLFGYIHEGGPSLDFSYVRGLNNYGIPTNDKSFLSSKIINNLTEDECRELHDKAMHQSAPYRTIGEVVDMRPHQKCIPVEASSMFCQLPLLQVSGLGVQTYGGQSGCPIFKCNGDLLGLILFTKGIYSFILPVNILRYCVNL